MRHSTLASIVMVILLTMACEETEPTPVATSATPASTVAPTGNITSATTSTSPLTPFTNVAPTALKSGYRLWNDRPGVVVFDYDRDGDLDFYITAEAGHPNWLYMNEGDGTFTNVARKSRVEATESNSTGAVACDIDNDGYQDLYVGAWGNRGDLLDFRSPGEGQGNRDTLFLNHGDGTFSDITDRAFGDAANVRSATSIACADVDGDGWLDIYVGNLADTDFRTFDSPSHPGHYNALYRNNGDLNGDVYVDLIGTNSSGEKFSGDVVISAPGPVFVWLNGGGRNHWITLRLKGRMAVDGTGSNADGIGARVYVQTASEGKSERWIQVQEVHAGSSYLSTDSIDLEFGLGTANLVEEITIFWPSGRRQTLNNLPADQVIVVTEPEA